MIELFAPVPPLTRGRTASHTESLAWALAISAFVHLAIAWRLAFGLPSIATRGEDGREGGGGATFEVSVRGPEADVPVPLPLANVPTSMPSPTTPAQHARPMVRMVPSTREGNTTAAPSADASEAQAVAAIEPTIAGAGTGADTTDSGRLRGRDDARLRALLEGSVGGALGGSLLGDVAVLERAARCADPVAGTWTAHRYSPEFRDWAHFTLSITRQGDELSGTIRTRMWRGMQSDTRPPPCMPGGWDYTVEMTAHGRVRGEHFDFGASEHHIAHVECASRDFGYNADHFTGEADVAIDQLHTTNNDGGRDVNAAYTFRRSSCQP